MAVLQISSVRASPTSADDIANGTFSISEISAVYDSVALSHMRRAVSYASHGSAIKEICLENELFVNQF